MNRRYLLTVFEIVSKIILVIAVISITFYQWSKFQKETTKYSVLYVERKLVLPSMTFCPDVTFVSGDENNMNMTFEEYMAGVPNVSDYFEWGYFTVYINAGDAGLAIVNNSYWRKSYYVLGNRLVPCLVMDPPEKTLNHPQKAFFGFKSNLSKISRKLSLEPLDSILVEVNSRAIFHN